MRIAGSIVGAALVGSLAACSHEPQGAQTAAPAAQAQAQPAAPDCPLQANNGVQVTVADIRDGVAITFIAAQPDGVERLRSNVHAMNDANDKRGDAFAVCPCAYGQTYERYGAAEPTSPPGPLDKPLRANEKGQTLLQPATPSAAAAAEPTTPPGPLDKPLRANETGQTLLQPATPNATVAAEPTSPPGQPDKPLRANEKGQTLLQGAAPSAQSSVDEIPSGAVLNLKAKDDAQIQSLREQVRATAQAMERSCGGVAP